MSKPIFFDVNSLHKISNFLKKHIGIHMVIVKIEKEYRMVAK